MARQRDYRAERLRRDARAQAAGFKSYRAQRYYVEKHGKRRRDEELQIPAKLPKGFTAAQVAKAHYDAFQGPTSVKEMGRFDRPSKAIRHWYVDVLQKYTSEQWDEKYGESYY